MILMLLNKHQEAKSARLCWCLTLSRPLIEAARDKKPILLLDDVFSDWMRQRQALTKFLSHIRYLLLPPTPILLCHILPSHQYYSNQSNNKK